MQGARPVRRFATPAGLVVSAVALAAAWSANAQVTRVTPTLGGQVMWTNNFDLQPDSVRESDFITTITPGVSVDYTGPRSFLRGFVRVPLIVYANHSDENRAVPSVDLNGRVEVVQDWFFIEAQASVTQTFFSPFGARSSDIENVTDNRYTTQTYRVIPYIQGSIGSEITYLLRNESIWTINTNAPNAASGSLANSYINSLFGTINRFPTPFGWGADISRTEYWFSGRENQLMELARVRGVWRPGAQLELFISGGYEHNQFQLSENSGVIYGAGVRWRPTDRTELDASFEERFFGTGYDVRFSHRTPRTVWTARASRNVTSYPELVASAPSGTSVPGLLSDLLVSRISDPVERAQFIVDFMAARGLPTVLTGPLDLYDPQIMLLESAVASLGLLGQRNAVFFSIFRAKREEISVQGDVLPPVFGARNNNEQVGASAAWSHQLGPLTSTTLSTTFSRTDADPPLTLRTDYTNVRFNVTRALSPKTTVFAGARWQKSDSTIDSEDYTEAAVFAGFNHSFR